MNKLMIVAKNVFMKRVKSWGYWGLVLGPIVFLAVVMGVGYYVAQSEDSGDEVSEQIAVVTESQAVVDAFSQYETPSVSVVDLSTYDSEEAAREAFDQEEIAGYLVAQEQGDTIQSTFYHDGLEQEAARLEDTLTQVQMNLRAQALDIAPEEAMHLSEAVNLVVQEVMPSEDNSDSFAPIISQGLTIISNSVIFFFILVYVGVIVEEIAREKGSRVMEILLSSVSATEQFFGKLLGMLGLIFLHTVIYVVLGMVGYAYISRQAIYQEFIAELPADVLTISGQLGWIMALYFLSAFLMYLSVSAFLGSLATKAEDGQKVVSPLSMFLLVGLYIGYFASAESALVQYASYFPPFTPLLMPMRVAAESASLTEGWLGVGWTFLFAIIIIFISLKFYQASVLVYDDTGVLNAFKQARSLRKSNQDAQQQ